MKTEKQLKFKLTIGYILLIAVVTASIVYILNQVSSLDISKDEIIFENSKVIQLSNIISDLYTTENTGRLALISYNHKDADNYFVKSDSLLFALNNFKDHTQDNLIKLKLDTVIMLMNLKSETFKQVLDVQSKYTNANTYDHVKSQLKNIQSSFKENTVKIDTVVDKTKMIDRIFTKRKTQQEERLKKENKRIVAEQKQHIDSLNNITEKVLNKAKQTENRLLKQYYQKEQELLVRNKILNDEIRELLVEIEKIIQINATKKHQISKTTIDIVSTNVAKVGIIITIVALIFGFIILTDLNKSAKNKRKLEELNDEMENLIKQKSFFMATISHDMVSPINSLLGFSSLLKNSLKTPKQEEYLKNIVHSTTYIKKMVDDLSLFSNLEYNKIKLKNVKFNFTELLHDIDVNLKNSALKKGIYLKFNIDERLNKNYFSDSYRIQQILTNVISNAIKFTHKGGVDVNAVIENKIAKINISDTGIGINTKDKKSLFTEFVQVHDTNKGNYGGSGLGLNITKRLIDLLKGSIDFESKPNKGTTFYINIPLKEFKQEKVSILEEKYEYDNARKLQNKKILVIDDDELQLKLIEEIFSGKVKKLTTLINGSSIKDYLNKDHYNLIITDMQMPFYSGIDVIRDIRSLEKYKHTPVIALTGKSDLDESDYLTLGFNMYMKKPLDINNLYNTIYKLLRIKQKTVNETDEIKCSYKFEHFDLTDLYNLLEEDKVAVNEILKSFILSYEQNIDLLKKAIKEKNIESCKQTAHKMLPMFRQLKINSVINSLEIIERNNLSIKEIEKYTSGIDKIMISVIDELKKQL